MGKGPKLTKMTILQFCEGGHVRVVGRELASVQECPIRRVFANGKLHDQREEKLSSAVPPGTTFINILCCRIESFFFKVKFPHKCPKVIRLRLSVN